MWLANGFSGSIPETDGTTAEHHPAPHPMGKEGLCPRG
jgi:hypothetical protein